VSISQWSGASNRPSGGYGHAAGETPKLVALPAVVAVSGIRSVFATLLGKIIIVTITYDPRHPQYLDQADVRVELARVLDVCVACRQCTDLCALFPSAFSIIDGGASRDAGLMTPDQQDNVASRCYQCKLCVLECPYVPGLSEHAIDFPKLMLRVSAMQRSSGVVPLRARVTDFVLNNVDRIGRIAALFPRVVNAMMLAAPGTLRRRFIAKTVGVSAVRVLSPFTKQRFSTWFRNRNELASHGAAVDEIQRSVVVFPTCVVEYQEPAIGRDLVLVYEHNGMKCALPDSVTCCGAPFLHSGDIDRFIDVAHAQVRQLARAVRNGYDIVVPQPTCSYVIKNDYIDYCSADDDYRDDVVLVAQHTFDSSEYLVNRMDKSNHAWRTEFPGEVPVSITFHSACHMRAQQTHTASQTLLESLGAEITTVEKCAGIDGLWGLKARNDAQSLAVTDALAQSVNETAYGAVVGDCHLANVALGTAIAQQPLHPMQILARAYGLDDHDS
jgi:Fe-S oxidoreductase